MDKLEQLQDEALTLIKTKKDKHMKEKKAPKTYTTKQIIKAIVLTIALLALGATAGITVEKAIARTIDAQVKEQTAEQVRAFTAAE